MISPPTEDPSVRAADAVARDLGAELDTGLTSQEAAHRLAAFGPKRITPVPRRSTWRRVLAHFKDPLVYLLLAAVAIAFIAWVIEGRAGWPVDAIIIAMVVMINAALGYAQEARAEEAVAALARMTAVTCAVVRDGRMIRVGSREVVRGDVMVLAEGDAVAADARLVEATSLRVQEASLTGESESVLKDVATLPNAVAPGDRLNMVFKGTGRRAGNGPCRGHGHRHGYRDGIDCRDAGGTEEAPTPLQEEISRLGKMLGIVVVGISVVVVTTILLISDIRGAGDVIEVLLLRRVAGGGRRARRTPGHPVRGARPGRTAHGPGTTPSSRNSRRWKRWVRPPLSPPTRPAH